METQRIRLDSSKPTSQAYLIPLEKNSRESIEVEEFLSIGRDDCNSLVLDDPFVSGRHARIERGQKGFILKDMRSRNGTTVNGAQVVEALLKANDKIVVGGKAFLFADENPHSTQLTSNNPEWNRQLKRLPIFANTDYTVLIIGPSGSGKEILSHWIHNNSYRRHSNFVTINCSALSENLIESELFGHIKGAFTGATSDRKGAFEEARGGTLFLDEIGDLPLSLQPKLLRALENQEIRPVGSDKTIQTNVRVIAATHKNLPIRVSKGEFREDLYHRLNICRLTPPALVERMEDFEQILYSIAKENRVGFSYSAIELLKNHLWPGNIRELKNLIIRAAAFFPGRQVQAEDVPGLIYKDANEISNFTSSPTELPIIKQIEKDMIIEMLEKNKGNQRKTAEVLQMPKSTLHDKLKTYHIDPKVYKPRGKVIC